MDQNCQNQMQLVALLPLVDSMSIVQMDQRIELVQLQLAPEQAYHQVNQQPLVPQVLVLLAQLWTPVLVQLVLIFDCLEDSFVRYNHSRASLMRLRTFISCFVT